MKITVIISTMLIAQVSASFFDVFQGAVLSVQNSFGKLFSDVVTDVKDTVDCTILAVEHVLSLSKDATERYYEKCGSGKNGTADTQPTVNQPAVQISILSDEEYLKKEIPEEIDARINQTLAKFLNGYNAHDRLEDVEKELAKETERLADVSGLVKQELDKLSEEIHFDFTNIEQKSSKPSIDTVLQELKLLEAIEKNIKNPSAADEIHKVIDDVLNKLNEIEAAEAQENVKVDSILKDLEKTSNNSYKDLRKQLQDWKEEEARHLDLIKNKMEEHEKAPEHLVYIQKNETISSTGEIINSTEQPKTTPYDINKQNITTVSTDERPHLFPRTLDNDSTQNYGNTNNLLTTITGDTTTQITSLSTTTVITKEPSSWTTSSPTTTAKIKNSSSVSPEIDYNIQTFTSTTTENMKSVLSSSTPKIAIKQLNTGPEQINDVVEAITPVVIITSSYANANKADMSTTPTITKSTILTIPVEYSKTTPSVPVTTVESTRNRPEPSTESITRPSEPTIITTSAKTTPMTSPASLTTSPETTSTSAKTTPITTPESTTTPPKTNLTFAKTTPMTTTESTTASPDTTTISGKTTLGTTPDSTMTPPETTSTSTKTIPMTTTESTTSSSEITSTSAKTTPMTTLESTTTSLETISTFAKTTSMTTSESTTTSAEITSKFAKTTPMTTPETAITSPETTSTSAETTLMTTSESIMTSSETTSIAAKTTPMTTPESTTTSPETTSTSAKTTSMTTLEFTTSPEIISTSAKTTPMTTLESTMTSSETTSTSAQTTLMTTSESTMTSSETTSIAAKSTPTTVPETTTTSPETTSTSAKTTPMTTPEPTTTSAEITSTSAKITLMRTPESTTTSLEPTSTSDKTTPMTTTTSAETTPMTTPESTTTSPETTTPTKTNPITTPESTMTSPETTSTSAKTTPIITTTSAETTPMTTPESTTTSPETTSTSAKTTPIITESTSTSSEKSVESTSHTPITSTILKVLAQQPTIKQIKRSGIVKRSTTSGVTETTPVTKSVHFSDSSITHRPTVPTPSLNAFLNYIDRMRATGKPSIAVLKAGRHHPAELHVPHHDVPLPYSSKHSKVNNVLPYKRGPSLKKMQHNEHYAKSNAPPIPMNRATHKTNFLLPPPPYARHNPSHDPKGSFSKEIPPPPRLAQNPPPSHRPINIHHPPDFFNRPTIKKHHRPMDFTTIRPPTTPKKDNFDDSDYNAFFHFPSKDSEAHIRAVRDARKLIQGSKEAHRVMDSILNNKSKGINAFNLRKALKLGK